MINKWLIALVMFIIAIFLIYHTLFLNAQNIVIDKGKNISIQEMQTNIIKRPLCIVIEKNGINDDNSINCALSYFQSAMNAFPKKRIDYYGLENNNCIAIIQDKCTSFPCNGRELNATINECIKLISDSGCYSIIVKGGNSSLTQSYENALEVFVDNTYKEGSCMISIKEK
ncbi:MAG: hypothetical protein QXS91_00800 [Candidatus Anstonellales archaeon]